MFSLLVGIILLIIVLAVLNTALGEIGAWKFVGKQASEVKDLYTKNESEENKLL